VPEAFVQLPLDEQASILQTCAGKLGRRPEHLEKDVWICRVLQALFTMLNRLPMAFKGGTSVSLSSARFRTLSSSMNRPLRTEASYNRGTVAISQNSNTTPSLSAAADLTPWLCELNAQLDGALADLAHTLQSVHSGTYARDANGQSSASFKLTLSPMRRTSLLAPLSALPSLAFDRP